MEFAGTTRAIVAPGTAALHVAREAAARGGTWGVVADRGFADAVGLSEVTGRMPEATAPLVGLVDEDPDVACVEQLTERAARAGVDGIIAIGGGSALCAGKAVAIRLTNPAPLDAYAGTDRLRRLPAPCIAVPTTGGSGSEVSEVVILHQGDDEPHLTIRGRGYAPIVAVLDGTLLARLPARPMLLAALDAYSHVCEALWSTEASSFTDALARRAGEIIRAALPRALDNDAAARQELVEGAAMANYACGNAQLALVHALATTPSIHLPHGYLTGVLLPHVATWCAPALREIAEPEIAMIEPFYAEIGFEARFAPGELTDADVGALVDGAFASPLIAFDPIGPTRADVEAVVRAAGAGT